MKKIALALHYDQELATAALNVVTRLSETNIPKGQRKAMLAVLNTLEDFDIT